MLNELNISYKHVDFNIHAAGAKDDPVYKQIQQMNPNATVPLLTRGDDVVWDSLAINLYLADACQELLPETGLIPAMQWSLWAAGLEEFLRTAQSHHSRLPESERDPEIAANARNALNRPFKKLDAWLKKSPYLFGDTFTVADVNVIAILSRSIDAGLGKDRWPELERWMNECGSRPALTRVFE